MKVKLQKQQQMEKFNILNCRFWYSSTISSVPQVCISCDNSLFVRTRFDFHRNLSPGAYPISYLTVVSPVEAKWPKPEDDCSAAFNIYIFSAPL
jgi:hypothetical protein